MDAFKALSWRFAGLSSDGCECKDDCILDSPLSSAMKKCKVKTQSSTSRSVVDLDVASATQSPKQWQATATGSDDRDLEGDSFHPRFEVRRSAFAGPPLGHSFVATRRHTANNGFACRPTESTLNGPHSACDTDDMLLSSSSSSAAKSAKLELIATATSKFEVMAPVRVLVVLRHHNRRILNFGAVVRALQSLRNASHMYPAMPLPIEVQFVAPETLTFVEQVRLMARSDVLIAVHGSVFVNAALFMRRGAVCIAIMQSRHLEFVLHQVLHQAGMVLHMLPVLDSARSMNCAGHASLPASLVGPLLHRESDEKTNEGAMSNKDHSRSESGGGSTGEKTMQSLPAHCLVGDEGTLSSSSAAGSSAPLLSRAGMLDCMAIRNCDLVVDVAWLTGLVETAVFHVRANRKRQQEFVP